MGKWKSYLPVSRAAEASESKKGDKGCDRPGGFDFD